MLRALTPSRCLFLLAALSTLLLFSLVPRYELLDSQPGRLVPRQGPGGGNSASVGLSSANPSASASREPTSAASTPATSADPTSASQQQPTSVPPTSAPPASATSDANSQSSVPPSSASNADSSPSNTPQQPGNQSTPPANSASATPSVSRVISTGANGETITSFVTITPSVASPSPSQSQKSSQNNDDDKGVSTATIIGLSVAGGVALIGIVGFVVWKFTRKRFNDSDFDDNEAIKWPELNTHGEEPHALPTNKTGNFGMETNSEVNLTRPDSRAGSFAPSASASAVDLYAAQDPYAVPPLPHLNPNQPYRDDPHAGYYDLYNGPVPQTIADAETASMQGGTEAIPMTQINRSRSPGPGMAYDMGGRVSPGPQQAYYAGAEQGRASPGPRAMSPGPQMAYGGNGRSSPGPQAAYGGGYGGRQSPGPQMAYGGGQ